MPKLFSRLPKLHVSGRGGESRSLECEWLHFDFADSSVEIDSATLHVWTDAGDGVRNLTVAMHATRNAANRRAGLDLLGLNVNGILQAKINWPYGRPVFELITFIKSREVQWLGRKLLIVGRVGKVRQPKANTILPAFNIVDPQPACNNNANLMQYLAQLAQKPQKKKAATPQPPPEAPPAPPSDK